MLRKMMFLMALLCAMTVISLAETPDMGPCSYGIYYTPPQFSYDYRTNLPPLFKANRWACVGQTAEKVNFPNSPANGTDTQFQLVVVVSGNNYPILYVSEENLSIWLADEQPPGSSWSVTQGTGIVTFTSAPGVGNPVQFKIF